MRCQRCWGLVIVETPAFPAACAEEFLTARCLNCGWIEDPVMRANRLANSDQSGIIPAVARSPRLPGRRSAEMPTS
jgi:hypothetical protein